MRLSISFLLPFTLGACLVPWLPAQEGEVNPPRPADLGVINDVDVIVTDLTEEKLNNPPKREIKLERQKEPLKRKLFKPDPKLFEQKFVARLELKTPENGGNFVLNSSLFGDSAPHPFIGQYPLLFPQNSSYSDYSKLSAGESIKRMIQFLPAGEPIAKEELDFFADPQTLGGVLSYTIIPGSDPRVPPRGWAFFALGVTPEEAERRANAFLTLLDQGAFRPIQLTLFKTREPLCVQLRDQRKALEKAQRTINVAQDELKSYVDFTPDMLSNLRVQQLQLDVELAGVKARIATCEKFLAQASLKTERRNQIEDLKVAAEIEFSGFEARRAKSEEIIGKVKTKTELLSKSSNANFYRETARKRIRDLEEQIRNLDAAIRAYAPLPLVDNKVVVQPLEWTQ